MVELRIVHGDDMWRRDQVPAKTEGLTPRHHMLIPRADVRAWWRRSREFRHAMNATHEDFRDAVYDNDDATY